MVSFRDLLRASAEDLIRIFYVFRRTNGGTDTTPAAIAKSLNLSNGQLMCGLGFNQQAHELPEILTVLGYKRFADIEERRNNYFAKDIYRRLIPDDILAIYAVVKDNPETLHSMQYLLRRRLTAIEQFIESTVNSLIIEKYKAEIRAIYSDGIASIDLAKERLQKMDSGFRALTDEVSIIAEYRLLPVGEILFMDTILPEEKRRLLANADIPEELIELRLQDPSIPDQEGQILREYLRLRGNQETGE